MSDAETETIGKICSEEYTVRSHRAPKRHNKNPKRLAITLAFTVGVFTAAALLPVNTPNNITTQARPAPTWEPVEDEPVWVDPDTEALGRADTDRASRSKRPSKRTVSTPRTLPLAPSPVPGPTVITPVETTHSPSPAGGGDDGILIGDDEDSEEENEEPVEGNEPPGPIDGGVDCEDTPEAPECSEPETDPGSDDDDDDDDESDKEPCEQPCDKPDDPVTRDPPPTP